MKILIWAQLDDASETLIKETLHSYDVDFVNQDDAAQAEAQLAQAEVVFGNVPPTLLETPQPNLRWLQLESVGFGKYHGQAGIDAITVTNLRGFFAEPVAESALAGILALYRKLDVLIPAQDETDRNWQVLTLRPQMRLLEGANVLLLGGGSINLRFKKLISGFDCDITVFSKSTPEADIYTAAELDAALPAADIVVACLPHSQETIGLVSAERLSLMKEDALFVNMGRGSAVDEPALIDALQNQRLGGAVLDVTYEEPLPKDHPLWDCPNTLITQHTGGGFREENIEKTRVFLRNLERYAAGEPVENIVNFERGY